jgi:hypothetical protein
MAGLSALFCIKLTFSCGTHACVLDACRYIANGVDVLGTILAVVLGLLYMFYQTMRALLGLIFAPSRALPAETKKRQ